MKNAFTVAALALLATGFLEEARAQTNPSSSDAIDAAPAPAHKDKTKKKKKHHGGPDDVQLGVLGGVGFPRPFSIGALLKIERAFAMGVEYSTSPTLGLGGADWSYHAIAADVRVFPTQSWFFLGMRVGKQHLTGTTTFSTEQTGQLTESLTMDTWFVNPRVGFLYTSKEGLTLGIDAGLQIPVSHTMSTTLPAGTPLPGTVDSVTNFLGAKIIPSVTVLQLGMMF
jgi:hypothetical protein